MSSPEMLKSILLLLSVSKEREQRDHKGPPNLGTGLGLCKCHLASPETCPSLSKSGTGNPPGKSGNQQKEKAVRELSAFVICHTFPWSR